MGKHQGVAGFQVGSNVLLIDVGLDLVVDQNHHDVAPLGGLGHGHDLETGGLSSGPVLAAGPQAHAHVAAGFLQVQGMGVALRAIAHDGNLLAVQFAQVTVLLIIHVCHSRIPP